MSEDLIGQINEIDLIFNQLNDFEERFYFEKRMKQIERRQKILFLPKGFEIFEEKRFESAKKVDPKFRELFRIF